MKKCLIVLLLLALCVVAHASAESTGYMGQPFPDFTVTDSQGNTFTLSEALKNHDAVLINLWASWCGPCKMEFPFLNEAYGKYGDRVAFIALSCEAADTMEIIEEYRQTNGIQFSMGRDEDRTLFGYVDCNGFPTTVIVDRFGNAAFTHLGNFMSTGQVTRVLDYFLDDSYTETVILDEIPADTSTGVFPVSAARMIHVENENAQLVLLRAEGHTRPTKVYIISDDTAHLTFDISAADNPASISYYNASTILELTTLLDTERNTFVYDQPMPADDYISALLVDITAKSDPDQYVLYLVPNEDILTKLADDLRSYGYDITLEYAEEEPEESAPLQAYLMHVVDQDGNPVPEMTVSFCTDTTCVMCTSDDDGTITFDGAPGVYHVQMIETPEGYSCDEDLEMYTDSVYSEWILRIRKD